MKINIRPETPQDYSSVELLTWHAFLDFIATDEPKRQAHDVDEHLLVRNMRGSPSFVPELAYVAELDGELVGNIMYTLSKVVGEPGDEHTVLTIGPVSVLPRYQSKGIGTTLMEYTIDRAIELGYRAIILYGHPEYYPRFGFKNAEIYGITTPEGANLDPFMALELYDGALNGITGKHYCDEVYENLSREDLTALNEEMGIET